MLTPVDLEYVVGNDMTPDTLFNKSMLFIIRHFNLVDSLVGFPSLVAEEMFKRITIYYVSGRADLMCHILKKFVEAYENLVLERLNLSNSLSVLNEHFEKIIIISRFVTELCVCGCFLGENHELFSHISEFECLKKVCLRDNCMNNSSMRLLTLRMRMYGVGGKEVESLNLAENNFTDEIIPWISAFPKLKFLNISGSKISERGIQSLETRYHLKRVFEEVEHEVIKNKGWVAALLEKWIEHGRATVKRKLMQRKLRPVYRNIDLASLKPSSSASSNVSLLFRRMPSSDASLDPCGPPVKKLKSSVNCNKEKIEEDIISQYM